MGHFPAVLKESKNPDAPLHIGGVLGLTSPLCQKLSEDETDILGWIVSRDQIVPREKVCPECFQLYEQGAAWRLPSAGS